MSNPHCPAESCKNGANSISIDFGTEDGVWCAYCLAEFFKMKTGLFTAMKAVAEFTDTEGS